MHILLAEDDRIIADGLVRALRKSGYAVDHVINGADADAALLSQQFDLLILDLGLPKMNGIEVLKRLRARKAAVPVLILTAQDGLDDRVRGLDAGADDYLTKPFSVRILVARVEALLRRDRLRADKERATAEVRAGHLAIDTDRLRATYRSVELTLTVTELRVLEAFAKNPGTVLGRARLLDIVRGDESVVGERLIDTYVKRLRRKLDEIEPGFDRIETVIGAGYKWRS